MICPSQVLSRLGRDDTLNSGAIEMPRRVV
jgi:hypothetical protein